MYEGYLAEFQGIIADTSSVFHRNVEESVDKMGIERNGKASTSEKTGPMDIYVQSLSLSDRLSTLSSSMNGVEKASSTNLTQQIPPPLPSPSSHQGYNASAPPYYPSIVLPSEDLGMWKNPPSTGRTAWTDQLTTGN